jgi:hypothetical protein
MRTFRRKLAVTPFLIGMALTALGLPASARAVYEENISRHCCEIHAPLGAETGNPARTGVRHQRLPEGCVAEPSGRCSRAGASAA